MKSLPVSEGVACGQFRGLPGRVKTPPGGCGTRLPFTSAGQCSQCYRYFHPACLEAHRAWIAAITPARRRPT